MKEQREKKYIALVVLLCFLFSIVMPAAVLAQDTDSSNVPGPLDIKGHWAENQITNWVERGLAKGYQDGNFIPNKTITRAEFITLINRAFGMNKSETVSSSDVQLTDWFYNEFCKAKAAGYISGYQDGTMKPNNSISRQEVAAIISKLLGMEECDKLDAVLKSFSDKDSMPQWSKNAIASISTKGFMNGYPDKSFQPSKSITRAEAIATLDRVVGNLYTVDGVNGPKEGLNTISGNATINNSNVTLRNTKITGNLILADGIGEGEVELRNVQVIGDIYIKGGGTNSINLNDCSLNGVIVNKDVRLVSKGTTNIRRVRVNENVILDGDFAAVEVKDPGKVIELDKNGEIETLNLYAQAEIKGKGKIEIANIYTNGVVIEKKPQKTVVAKGFTAKVNNKVLKEGTYFGSSGGGGGGGSSSGGGGGDETIEVSAVTLDRSVLDLEEDQSETLKATIKPSNASNKKVTWTSSDDSIAKVTKGADGKAKVVGKNAGTATITVKTDDGSKTDTCKVVVYKVEKPELELQEDGSKTAKLEQSDKPIKIKTKVELPGQESIQLGIALPSIGKKGAITVKSADAFKPSTDTPFLGLDIELEGIPENQKVKVELPIPKGLNKDNAGAYHHSGQVWQYREAKIVDGNLVFETTLSPVAVAEKVGNPSGLTAKYVEGTGVVLNWIAVTSADGYYVYKDKNIDPIKTIEGKSSTTYTDNDVTEGEYTYYVRAYEIRGNEVKFESANSNVVKVTVDTTIPKTVEVAYKAEDSITAINPATVTFANDKFTVPVNVTEFTFKDGNKEMKATFADEHWKIAEVVEIVPVEAISVVPEKMTLTAGGAKDTITATVTPENATNKVITWTSDNDKVAAVDENGVVTPVAAGTATITAKTVDGGKTATCKVRVEKSGPAEVERDDKSVTQDPGSTGGDLTYSFDPEEKKLTISNGDVPYVEATGDGFPPTSGNWVGVAIKLPADIEASSPIKFNDEDVTLSEAEQERRELWYYFKANEKEEPHTITIDWSEKYLPEEIIIATQDLTLEAAPVPVVEGTIERDGGTGGDLTVSVDGNKVSFTAGEIKWYPADESVGRNEAGNRVGVQITAPEGFDTKGAKVTIGETEYNWDEIKDGENFFWWYPLVTEANRTFTATVVWNTASTQIFTVDTTGTTLEAAPASDKNAVTINNNFSNSQNQTITEEVYSTED